MISIETYINEGLGIGKYLSKNITQLMVLQVNGPEFNTPGHTPLVPMAPPWIVRSIISHLREGYECRIKGSLPPSPSGDRIVVSAQLATHNLYIQVSYRGNESSVKIPVDSLKTLLSSYSPLEAPKFKTNKFKRLH